MRVRSLALISAVAGGAGSVALTLYAGHRNPSVILMALFVVWVASPFVALSRRGSITTLLVTIVSTAIYGFVALGPPRTKIAFTYLVVPAASWLVIAAAAIWRRRATPSTSPSPPRA